VNRVFEMGSWASSKRGVSGEPGIGAGLVRAAVVVLALSAPALALAGPPAGPAKPAANPAKEHFESGQALFDQKKYDAALVLFRQAYEETKSPNAHLMVARSLLALGRLAEAYDELLATMREAGGRADTEPKYAAARDAAAAEIAPLESKVAKLVVTFSGLPPAGARVTVNGVLIPAAKLGAQMAMLPGPVEVTCEGLGPEPMKRTEKLGAGETKTIVLTPPAPATAPPAPTGAPPAFGAPTGFGAPTSAPDGEPPQSGGMTRNIGYGVVGVGVVGVVLFGVGVSVAQSKFDQLKKECGAVRCKDPKYADVVDTGKSMDLLTNIGFVVGIGGLFGGAAMILFGGPHATAQPPSTSIVVGPNGAMIKVGGSF
jgi:hypothetical protein